MRAYLSKLIRRFPPVARRDRRISYLVQRQDKQRGEILALRERAKRSERVAADLSKRLARSEARLQATRELAQRAEYPSFGVMLTYYRAHIRRAKSLRASDVEPVLQIPRKLRNISLVQSHGIAVPRIYQVWNTR